MDLMYNEAPVQNHTNKKIYARTNQNSRKKDPMYDFSGAFDQRVFEEKSMKLNKNCTNKNYKFDGKKFTKYFEKIRKKGQPKVGWLKPHKLTSESPPIDLVNEIFTIHGGKRNCKKQTLFHDWAS